MRAGFLRAALLGLAATTLVALGWIAGRSGRAPEAPSFRALTFRQGHVFSARFEDEGSSVVFGASWDGGTSRVFRTMVEELDPRPVDVPPGDVFAVMRGGELLLGLDRAFHFDWLTRAALARERPGAGPPRVLAPIVRAADATADGAAVALVRPTRNEHLLELPEGTVRYRTSGWIGDLRVLPDGTGVAFLDHPVWGDRRGRLLLSQDGQTRPIVEGEFETLTGLALAPGGREVYFSAARSGPQTEVFAADLEGSKPRSVLRAPGSLRVHDAVASRLLFSREEQRQTIGYRSGSAAEQDICWTSHAQIAALSADGTRALVTVYDDRGGGNGTTWVRDVDGGAPVHLGPGEATDLSPDGKWAVAIRRGEVESLALLPTGPGDARTLVLPRAERYHWARFTPDGRRLVVSANESGRKIRLYRLDLETGDSAPITPEGVGYLLAVRSSGDAVTSEDVDLRIRLFPLEGGSPRAVTGLLPGEVVLLWLPGDEAFLAATPNSVPLRVFRVDALTGARRLHDEVGPTDRNGLRSVWPVAYSRGGSAVAYSVWRLFSQLFVAETDRRLDPR